MRAKDFITERKRRRKNKLAGMYYGYPWAYSDNNDSADVGDVSETAPGSLDVPTPDVKQLAKKHKVSAEKIKQQLLKGIKVEREHTTSDATAREIALDHLNEFPNYYDRLERAEIKENSSTLTPEAAQELWVKNYGEQMAERVYYSIKEQMIWIVSDFTSLRRGACDTQDRMRAMSKSEFARWLLVHFTPALEAAGWPVIDSEGLAKVIKDEIREPLLQDRCILEVARAKISTDPKDMGSWVRDQGPQEKTVMLPTSMIDVLEPVTKFDDPEHATNLKRIVSALRVGKKLPPILVRRQGRRYQIVDGHHRFAAHRILGLKTIPARIVASFNVTDVTENFADGKVKGKSRPGRVKKAGASCKGSVTSLRQKASKYGGEKGKMYHWCANMKAGRNK